MKITQKIILVSVLIISLAIALGLGFLAGKNSQPSIEKVEGLGNKELGQPTNVDFSLFWDSWRVIEEKYVDRQDLDRQQMVYGAISGMVKSLGDPYSVFMEPVESKKFQDDISGSFSGIGAEIGMRKGFLTIIAPLKDTPAYQAGLLAGDRVLKIDDTITVDLTLDEAVNLIRGEKGTEVILLVARDDWDQPEEIKIIRDNIQIPILDFEIKGNNIAYIQIYHFTSNLSQEFEKVVQRILDGRPNGIILDLRNNPGGYLEVAVDLASWFLPKGEIVAIEDFGNSHQEEYRSYGYKPALTGYPLIVLINQGSASAAEILAGALRDNLGIKIVGAKSFGKGSVQELEKLRQGASIKVTIAKWLTPNGVSIQEEGIEPDETVEITSEDIEAMRDPQLEQALELFQ